MKDAGGFAGALHGFFGGPADAGHVAHLAGAAGVGLAVDVELGAGNGGDAGPVGLALDAFLVEPLVAEDVEHHGVGVLLRGAERKAGHRADLLFVLARDARVDRGVAGVVRTGSKLVDEDRAVFKDEELDAEDADVVERLGDLGGIAAGAGGRILVDAGGKDGDREDAVAVEVLGNGERGRFAVRVARDDDGDLKLEGEALFEHAVHAAEVAEGLADVLDRGDSGLAFAVIAEAGGLENAGQERGVEGVDVGGLTIDDDTKEVFVDDEPIKLTPIEYNILLLLTKNAGKVFSIDEIYKQIWNEEAIGADNTVAVHIRHIREKIEINPREPRYLKVVWGVGYKIEKQ